LNDILKYVGNGYFDPRGSPQPHTGEDDKDIRITIRQIVEGGDKD
jgi:hypothetical protein